ncbi:hypothetical protein [Arenibacter latericius]|uniref:hypothetical protein n=1 Tax=Arenibacter latericius TaxID=86104 RepID=UPI00040177FA|nr:hypothetical protein [Arenibacter latericius]
MIVGEHRGQLYKVEDAKKKTIYDYTIEYLEGKYDIMYNEISYDFQISFKKRAQWSYLNLNSLIIELAKAGVDISTGKLEILIRSELIPMGNNPHIRQKFFDKDTIDIWLLGEPDVSDETLEEQFNRSLLRNRK